MESCDLLQSRRGRGERSLVPFPKGHEDESSLERDHILSMRLYFCAVEVIQKTKAEEETIPEA